jgi:hypothetical protein
MTDLVKNQEKTLGSMFRAQRSLRNYLEAANASPDNDNDNGSILTSTTDRTVLTASTASDFETVIKGTAVYKRCMERRYNESTCRPGIIR